jgi:hypothetical protein
MGMRSRAARGVGSLVHGRNAAKAHVLANRPKYGIAPKGTRTASNAASRAMDLAIAKRQTQVGRRVIGGGVALGGVGYMGRNRDGSRGGFKGPQGSGRYA